MKATLAKGTRDFLPLEVKRREYIFETIESVFRKYGYDKIETPAIENLQTLTGKYGEEGDKLLFKVLNNGDFLKKADKDALERMDSSALASSISKRGLRYDLTVPFSRFVVMHQQDIEFPFKRYQIQPVWRGDRPQKGRYQEFYQCDADIVGTDSLISEAELCLIYDEVFTRLNLDVDIRLNNRKILYGIAEYLGVADRVVELTIAIDKLDKVGIEGVEKTLLKQGFASDEVNKLKGILRINSLDELKTIAGESEALAVGVEEMEELLDYLESQDSKQNITFDVSLARGLDYYTGTIYEVVAPELNIGSLGGGGRYDNLTAIFGMKNVSGVGISFGAARIYDGLLELDLFPADISQTLDAIFVTFDKDALKYAFKTVQKLRGAGCKVDLFPDTRSVGKQLKYVDKRNIPYAVIIGSQEMKNDSYLLKNMKTGEESALNYEDLLNFLKKG